MYHKETVEAALSIVNKRMNGERAIPLFTETKTELQIVIDGLLDLYNESQEEDTRTSE